MKAGVFNPMLWLLTAAVSASALFAACSKPALARFPHTLHLTGIECGQEGKPDCLSCASCHSPKQESRAHKLPNSSLCDSCHQEQPQQTAQILALVPPRPNGEINFDHDQHLAMPRIAGQCVGCHAGIVGEEGQTLPEMAECFSCHEHEEQWQRAECSPCHERTDLEHVFPKTFLQHDAGFLKHHGAEATHSEKLCQSCHSQSDCQSCHDMTQTLGIERRAPERIEAEFVHRGDFMVRHAIDARAEPSKCANCHTPQMCDSCHVARGVSGNRLGAPNPHPPGWVGHDVAAADFHGRAARRDLVACASCHDQGPATNCIRCHKVGAYGGNPHPRGWQSAQQTSAQMCRYCHEAR